MPAGRQPRGQGFSEEFSAPDLAIPWCPRFVKDEKWRSFARVLDISNAISHWQKKPEWKLLKDSGLRAYQWQPDDPLANVFLMQLGAYPSADEIGVDYAELIEQVAEPTTYKLETQARIPADILEHPDLGTIGRLGVERHYINRSP